MLEVIKALAILEDSSLSQVMTVADEKCKKREAFTKKIFLESVEK